MPIQKREYVMQNAAAVPTTTRWYPLIESTAPDNLAIEQRTPFKSLRFENNSGEPYDLILDPAPLSSAKVWRVPDGTALSISEEDNIAFFNVVCLNQGALETAINELKLIMRNY